MFISSYMLTARWACTDPTGEPLDMYDFHPDTILAMEKDCYSFLRDHKDVIDLDPVRAGEDFWLTRNRHGAGFWDGFWPNAAGEATRLTEDAHSYGEAYLYIGEDGLLHLE